MSNLNKSFKAYLFDLDGTITASKLGIFNCIKYALDYFKVKCPNDEFLNNLIGPPLADSFSRYFGFSNEQAKLALEKYRERYEKIGIFELELYPHTVETLKKLNEQGKIIALATSKVEVYARKILDNLGISKYFHHIQGGDIEGKFCEKADVVRFCLNELNSKFSINKDDCVMVGDRKYDIIGAKENQILSIGVTWGYAEQNELEQYGADYIINSFEEL